MAVARRLLTLLLAFAAMVAGIEGLHRAIGWWRGTLPAPSLTDYGLMAGLPLVAWLWWRYVSPFGRGRGRCLDASCRRDDDAG